MATILGTSGCSTRVWVLHKPLLEHPDTRGTPKPSATGDFERGSGRIAGLGGASKARRTRGGPAASDRTADWKLSATAAGAA
jgi:hypothetical protein